MAELDPNFQYRQAAQQNFMSGIQLGSSIAERRAMMAIRQQEVQLRQQQMEQAMADALVQRNLQDAQAQMYRQRMSEAIQESEANKADLPMMAQFMNQASLYAEDTTGQVKAPEAPVFQNPRMTIQAQNVLRDARAKNVGMRAQAKRVDDAIEAGAVTFGPNGQMMIDDQKLNDFVSRRQAMDLSRTPMYADEVENYIALNPSMSESEKTLFRARARYRGGVSEGQQVNQLNALKELGLVSTPSQESEAQAMARTKGLAPSGKTSDAVFAADSAVSNIRNAQKRIEEFNAKYNSATGSTDAFKEFVGPLDNPVLNATGRFVGITELDQKEARSIIQQLQQVILDFRNAKFGATLTEGEQRAMDEIVGSPKRNDFQVLTATFADNLERGLKNSLGRQYKYNPAFVELYRTYTPERFQGAPAGNQPSQGQPSRIRLRLEDLQ
jgi:hypothetical protein